MALNNGYINEADNTDADDRENVYRLTIDTLNKLGITPKCSKSDILKFISHEKIGIGGCKLCLCGFKNDELDKACSEVNKVIRPYGGKLSPDNYGTAFLSLKESAEETLDLPGDYTKPDVRSLLDSTDPKDIYLSSDWHFFKNHYKREANYVNTQKIVTWCRKNIRPDQVFMFLGDISFRYANKEDQAESQRLMKSIPGIKILILGNHDRMAGSDYYTGCGFDYVMEELEWKNLVFSHRPINMETYPDGYLNIHGHIHNMRMYNTTDGKRNINVYPYFYGNKPVTLDYCLNHVEELTKDNYWNANAMLGEQQMFYVPARQSGKSLKEFKKFCEAATRLNSKKSVVYYSQDISPTTIAYMTSLYKDKLRGNVAIKLHCGEEGNENWLSPRLLSTLMKHIGNRARFCDSNVAYDSIKQTTEGHLKIAKMHGFNNFDVLDADGDIVLSIPGKNRIDKAVSKARFGKITNISNGPHLSEINVGSHLANYDSMIVYSHFKGHSMAGYGGAIKNIGMGAPSGKVGKHQVHGEEFKWGIDFIERLVESASAVQDYFEGNIIYVNVLKNISIACDCEKGAPKATIKDLGVLVSDDIVAIEQASLDLIRNAKYNGELMDRIASRGGTHQVEFAEFLGMGSRDYNLYDINNNKLRLEASYLSETKRSNLPDSAFGIPEDRKYPLDSKQHVKSAIKLFGHAEESKKKSLAKRIRTAAKKYDISIPENTQCYKYLTEGAIEEFIPPEVENIVFDMGDVLVGSNAVAAYMSIEGISYEYAQEIFKVIHDDFFYAKDVDAYLLTEEQAKIRFVEKSPEHLHQFVDSIFESFGRMLFKLEWTDIMLKTLKERGYKLYYLSNWDLYSIGCQKEFFEPLISKFDGGIFSYQVKCQKPEVSIYNILIDRYHLDPSKCIFFDDREENVETAKLVGMYAELFDKDVTPMRILGLYNEVPANANRQLLVHTNNGIESLDVDSISWWYLTDIKTASSPDEEHFFKNIEGAIKQYAKDEDFKDKDFVDKFVYVSNGEERNPSDGNGVDMTCAGKIHIAKDRSFVWIIQYPLSYIDGKVSKYETDAVNEWCAASVNPVIGITKPFILKICSDNKPTEYALSMDIASDKYLIVDENSHLSIVNPSYFGNACVEEYEFTGNKYYLDKIAKAYAEGSCVDNTFFYTALTGKPMLTEDQIDFDSDFSKVDFDLITEKRLAEIATLKDSIIRAMGYKTSKLPIEESYVMHNVRFKNKIDKYNECVIREDYEGLYFFNTHTGKRCASVPVSSMMTEAMLKSILF